jgi:hypothetical protein
MGTLGRSSGTDPDAALSSCQLTTAGGQFQELRWIHGTDPPDCAAELAPPEAHGERKPWAEVALPPTQP